MALVLADRVRDTTTTTGTGTVTLSGTAPTGYQNFSVVGDGNTTYYTINAASQWEVGIGTYSSTGPTLSRDTVLASSNGGALVNFSSGTKDVFVTYPAEKSVNQNGSVISAGSAVLGVANGGTGATSLSSGYVLKGNGTSAVSASVIYDNGTNVGIGTATPAGKFSSNTGASGTYSSIPGNVNSWDSTVSLFGAAGSSTGAAVGIGMTALGGYISSLAPSVAWQNLYYQASTHYWYNGTTQLGILNTAGDFTALGSVRSPIFYDLNNTAYYLDAAGNSVFSNVQNGVNYTSGGGGGRLVVGPGSPYSLRQEFGSDNTGWRYGIAKNVSGTVTDLFYVQDTGPVVAIGDMRAPIFYDSNNTAYYLDPASTSNLYTVITNAQTPAIAFKGDIDGAKWMQKLGGYNLSFMNDGGAGFDSVSFDGRTYYNKFYLDNSGNAYAYSSFRAPIFYDSNNTAYYLDAAGNSVFSAFNIGGGEVYFYGSATNAVSIRTGGGGAYRYFTFDASGNFYALNGSVYGGRFYDQDNTAYYVDPAGTSNINSVIIAGTISIAGTYGRSAAGTGYLNGNYNSVETNYTTGPIYCINSSSYAPSASSLNSMYGIGYTDGANSGVWSGGGWGLYVAAGSGARVFLDGSNGIASATASLRAPIFYDTNDTAYFVDPHSTSVMSVVRANSIQFSNGNTAITLNNGTYQILQDPTGRAAIYLGGSDPGNYYDNTTHYFRDRSAVVSMTVTSGIGQANGSFRAPIFYDSDNTGYYVNPAGTSYVLGEFQVQQSGISGLRIISGTGTQSLWVRAGYDTDGTGTPASSPYNIEFQSSGSSGGSFTFVSGNTKALTITSDYAQGAGSVRAPVFYDSNDTNYYLDPASTSNLNRLLLQPRIDNYYVGSVSSTDPVSDWQSLTNTTGQFVVSQFNNFGAGGFSNYPSGVYTYGAVLSWRTTNHSFQLFASHTGDLAYKTQWNNDNYSGWLTPVVYGRNAGSSSGKTIYGTVLYDADNTGYYLDPASTSYLNTVSMGAQTWRGDITWNTGVNVLVPASAECSFDINSSGVWQVWDLTTGAPMIKCPAGSNVEIGQAGSRGLYVYGSITASGNVTAYSDARVKTNVARIEGALDKVSKIGGYTYNRTDLADTERTYGGVIAQEIEAVLPEAIFDSGDKKSVDYNATIALLIEAIKELKSEVNNLKAALH